MSSNGEGVMNEVLKRLGALETSVATIAATIPHLGTKAGIDRVEAMIPHLATKADLYAMESKIIKWIIATVITASGLAFTFAKFVH